MKGPYLESCEMKELEKTLNDHVMEDTFRCWRLTRFGISSASLACEGNISKLLLRKFDEIKRLVAESYDKPKPTPYENGQIRVALLPAPEAQKYKPGTRVKIINGDFFGKYKGKSATVICTYGHAYGGSNVTDYVLDVDGMGSSAWHKEQHLKEIK